MQTLQQLAVCARLAPPKTLTDSLRGLQVALQNATPEFENLITPSVRKKISPNQHSWPETVKVMGAPVKTKRKSTHTDPYAGDERSGKKAKPDAVELRGSGSGNKAKSDVVKLRGSICWQQLQVRYKYNHLLNLPSQHLQCRQGEHKSLPSYSVQFCHRFCLQHWTSRNGNQ